MVYRRYDNELDARLEEKIKNLKGNSEFKMIIRGEMPAVSAEGGSGLPRRHQINNKQGEMLALRSKATT